MDQQGRYGRFVDGPFRCTNGTPQFIFGEGKFQRKHTLRPVELVLAQKVFL